MAAPGCQTAAMHDDLIRLTATEAAARLKRGEISPLELVEAAAARIAEVEPAVNALPTLCLDRARDHARRLMAGHGRELEGGAGWLGGLPVSIKDLTDVAGVRTTYGSPLFRDHVPTASHPVVQRIESRGGIVIGKSNTPEFGAGGSTFNEVFGRTRNPWNTALTCGGSTGGGAVSVATGEVFLAQGTDHAGSLRRPGTYCSVVGIRPSPGRVTRGTVNNLFATLSVQGPMARNIPDLALFLDTMAGWCPLDPLTYDAPGTSYAEAVSTAENFRPRVAFTLDYKGALAIDRESRAICEAAIQRFADAGCVVEESSPEFGELTEALLVLRSQHFVVDRELQLLANRESLKPDIIWNTERGLNATPSQIAWADRERTRFFREMTKIFARFDVFVTPSAPTPAFDVMLRAPESIAGQKLANYMGGSMLNAAMTMAGSPAVAIPCGFDQYGRPIGLQIAAAPRRDDTALRAAALYETMTGLNTLLPIEPRPGVVPPAEG